MTKLHTAAYNNEVNNLEKSLADFSINELESVTGETALHWAISGGAVDAVKFLLAKEADIYQVSTLSGYTVFLQAIKAMLKSEDKEKFLQIIRLLLEREVFLRKKQPHVYSGKPWLKEMGDKYKITYNKILKKNTELLAKVNEIVQSFSEVNVSLSDQWQVVKVLSHAYVTDDLFDEMLGQQDNNKIAQKNSLSATSSKKEFSTADLVSAFNNLNLSDYEKQPLLTDNNNVMPNRLTLLWHVPAKQSSYIPRPGLEYELESVLKKITNNSQKRVNVYGERGIGKTSFVANWVCKQNLDFDDCIWFSFNNIEADYFQFARDKKIIDDDVLDVSNVIKQVKDWFFSVSLSRKMLVVYDDVESLEKSKPYLPSADISIILISRSRLDYGFNLEISADFSLYKSDRSLNALFKKISAKPGVMHLAMLSMRLKQQSSSNYNREFSRKNNVESFGPMDFPVLIDDFVVALKILLDSLQKKNQNARECLNYLTWLAEAKIPVELIDKISKANAGSVSQLSYLIESGFLRYVDLDKQYVVLEFSIHLVKNYIKSSEINIYIGRILIAMHELLLRQPATLPEGYNLRLTLIPHFAEILQYVKKYIIEDNYDDNNNDNNRYGAAGIFDACIDIAHVCLYQGQQFSLAKSYYEIVENSLRRLPIDKYAETKVKLLIGLSDVYKFQGNYKNALQLLLEANKLSKFEGQVVDDKVVLVLKMVELQVKLFNYSEVGRQLQWLLKRIDNQQSYVRAVVLYNWGVVDLLSNKIDDGKIKLLRSKEIISNLFAFKPKQLALIDYAIGVSGLIKNDFENAQAYFLSALDLFRQHKNWALRFDVLIKAMETDLAVLKQQLASKPVMQWSLSDNNNNNSISIQSVSNFHAFNG